MTDKKAAPPLDLPPPANGWADLTTAEALKEGETLHGFYLGFNTVVMANGNECKRHAFTMPDGDHRQILGAALLDSQLSSARLGFETMITRTKDTKKTGTGRSASVYMVRQRHDGKPVPQDVHIGRNPLVA